MAIEKSNQECGHEKNGARKCENKEMKKTTFYIRVVDLGLVKSTKYAGRKKKRKDQKSSLKSSEKTENSVKGGKLEEIRNKKGKIPDKIEITRDSTRKTKKYGKKFRKCQKQK